ncbi:DUF4232 domain-containing protein [Kocuria sp. M1R5S2]|uniref:DUF4232 domain-containing protein n=1 Tax=Kocuria rhizosphaerae TaxID=3376285 RepID=UPI0037AEEA73
MSPSTLSRPFPAALALLSVLALAACSGGTQDQDTPSPTDESTTGSTAEPTEESTAAPSPTPTATAGDPARSPGGIPAPAEEPDDATAGGAASGAGSRWCTAGQLELVAVPAGGAAGSVFVNLTATNTSDTPCTLGGYPGVSFVDASGAMIGAPAVRDATTPGTGQAVAPGESVSAVLRVGQAGNYPACDARAAAGLRVYPPESTESVVVPFPAQACADPQIQQLEIQGFGT